MPFGLLQERKLKRHAGWTASLDVGLVSVWKMDGVAGAVVDSHGSNDGVNEGATRGVTGIIDNAFDFDGTNDLVNISDDASLDPTAEISISLWANLTFDADNPLIFKGTDSNEKYLIYLSNLGRINFYAKYSVSGRVRVFADVATENEWNNIIVTYTDGNASLYRNGILAASSAYSGTLSGVDTTNLFLGYSSSGYVNGKIDEVRIWNRTLSSAEARQVYEYTPLNPLTVTLNFPIDNYETTYQNVVFNATVIASGNF